MTTLVLGLAGAAAGFALGGPTGAQLGWSLGSALGSSFTSLPDINGPTLSDTSVASNTYGNMREIRYGTNKMTCKNIIWSTKRVPTKHTETSGGKGGPSQSVTRTTYAVSFAVALGECGAGGISGVRRIWLNKNLVRDWSSTNTGFTGDDGSIRVYSGADTQLPSALMEAHLGVGNVPAYRRTPYIEFEDLQLEPYSNQMPLVEAEVVELGTSSAGATIVLDTSAGYYYMIEHPYIQGVMLALWENPSTHDSELHVLDYVANTIQIVPLGHTNLFNMCYVPTTDELWIATGIVAPSESLLAVAVSAQTYQVTRNINVNLTGSNTWGGSSSYTPVYDPTLDAVWFFTNTSTANAGINVIDVTTLEYVTNGIDIGSIVAWFTASRFAFGNGKLVLGSYYGNLFVFSDRQYLATIATKTNNAGDNYNVYYDSLRNRFFWYYDTGKVRTIDAVTLEVTEFTNTLTVAPLNESMSYHAAWDKIFLYTTITINVLYRLYQLNAETFAVENSWDTTHNIDPGTGVVQLPLTPEYVAWINSDKPELFPLVQRLTPGTTYLSSAVADICNRNGLAAGDIDVSQLTDILPGFMIDRQMTGRAAIEALQPAFYFDAVESD